MEMVEPSKEFRIAYMCDGKPMKSMTGFKQWDYRTQSVIFQNHTGFWLEIWQARVDAGGPITV